MGKSERRKGHDWERKVANDLKEIDPNAMRNLEYQKGQGFDITTELPFRIQCKSQKRINFLDALKEADKNSKFIPLVVGKVTNKGEYAFLKWSDFREILKRLKLGGTLRRLNESDNRP